MTSDAPLRHEALIYESQDEYVTRSVSLLNRTFFIVKVARPSVRLGPKGGNVCE